MCTRLHPGRWPGSGRYCPGSRAFRRASVWRAFRGPALRDDCRGYRASPAALLGPTGAGRRAKLGIACRSVHLKFPAPEGAAYINELTIDESAEGTYFCVCGFNQGYFGLQELAIGKKVIIFSIWDPGRQDDPNSVAEDRRVKLVAKDDAVRIGRFGNEGTGGQSFLDYDWKPGATYQFLVTAKIEGERTAFAAYFCPPEAKAWRHLATFSTLAGGKHLGGYYAFIEDFRRNRISATRERQAQFGNGWVQGTDGRWTALTRGPIHGRREPRGEHRRRRCRRSLLPGDRRQVREHPRSSGEGSRSAAGGNAGATMNRGERTTFRAGATL